MLLPSLADWPGYYRVYHALKTIPEVSVTSFSSFQVLEEAVYLVRYHVRYLGQNAARHVWDSAVCQLDYRDYDIEESVETVIVLSVYL